MPAAALIPLIAAGASAGATIYGATKSSGAATTAAGLQADAAQQAIDFAKQKQAEQLAAFAPYQALGANAVQNLPSAVRPMPTQGPPAPYTTQPQATASASQPTTLAGMAQPLLRSGPVSATTPYGASVGANFTANPILPPGSTALGGMATLGSGTGQAGASGTGEPTVLLQAPDGSQKQVPQSQAQFYISRGAKQVG